MWKIILDFFELLFIGSAVFLLAWIFLAEPLEVNGDSMHPTLKNREQLVAEKVSIKFNEPNRGDIIVLKSPQNPNTLLVKRLVALPTETVEIRDNAVFINGEKLIEPYLSGGTETIGKNAISEGEEFVIPANSYIVLGDNRENSTDSRQFGAVKQELLVGKAIMVYSPIKNLRRLNNSNLFAGSRFINKLYYTFDF